MIDRSQHRIQFKKPDLQELNRCNTVVDMHFHTRHSDGNNTVRDIIDYADQLSITVQDIPSWRLRITTPSEER